MTDKFLHYLEHSALVFELFGHYDSHPLHDQSEYVFAAVARNV